MEELKGTHPPMEELKGTHPPMEELERDTWGTLRSSTVSVAGTISDFFVVHHMTTKNEYF